FVEEILPVVADARLACHDQLREQARPVRYGALGELADADHHLTALVAPHLFDSHLDGRFEVLVLDLDAVLREALGVTAADPLSERGHLAEPRIFLGVLIAREIVRDQVDPGLSLCNLEPAIVLADDRAAREAFDTHRKILLVEEVKRKLRTAVRATRWPPPQRRWPPAPARARRRTRPRQGRSRSSATRSR